MQKTIDQETNKLEEARLKKDRNFEQKALSSLGLCFARLGQTQKAIQYFEEQLEIVREQDDPKKLCELLANLGDANAILGNIERARNFYQEQLAIANTQGYLAHVGSSYNDLGFVHVKQNEILKGIECYVKALDVYQELKEYDKALELVVGIGLNYQKIGKLEKTCENLERALDASKYGLNCKRITLAAIPNHYHRKLSHFRTSRPTHTHHTSANRPPIIPPAMAAQRPVMAPRPEPTPKARAKGRAITATTIP
jgi:tetratricopeptide (TPR) repeat protein